MKIITFAAFTACMLLSACRSPKAPGGDAVYNQSAQRGYTAFARGDALRALPHYQQATLRALELDDADKISEAAYNAAACRFALRDYREAQTDGELSQQQRSTPENTLLLAHLALKLKATNAVELAKQALERAPAGMKQEAQQVLAAALISSGDLPKADTILKKINLSVNKSLQARIYETEGDLDVARGRPEAALVNYMRSEALYADTAAPFARQNILLRAAELHRQAEAYGEAAKLQLKAARIATGIGMNVQAVLDEAGQNAVKSGNGKQQEDIRLFADWLEHNQPE